MYYIEVYDNDVKMWVDAFPFNPDGVYLSREQAEYEIECLEEVDRLNREVLEYRIAEYEV